MKPKVLNINSICVLRTYNEEGGEEVMRQRERETQLKGVVEVKHHQSGYPEELHWWREGRLKSGVRLLETGAGEAMDR